eukprot:3846924-Prymnesium_polylepis.1
MSRPRHPSGRTRPHSTDRRAAAARWAAKRRARTPNEPHARTQRGRHLARLSRSRSRCCARSTCASRAHTESSGTAHQHACCCRKSPHRANRGAWSRTPGPTSRAAPHAADPSTRSEPRCMRARVCCQEAATGTLWAEAATDEEMRQAVAAMAAMAAVAVATR